jgi:hypothetical protein
MDDTSSRDEGSTAFDPTRRLCADGSCVGVLGGDGRCGVCGRTEAEAAAGEEAAPPPVGATGEDAHASEGGFDAKRRLCEDGACVGVVAEDGACRVCGRRAS